jgi:hypothetical protein
MTRPQDPVPAPVTPHVGWCVLVEEYLSSDATRWAVSDVKSFPTREAALDGAAMMARQYQPRHPRSKRNRRIIRTDEGVWTVLLKGMTRSFHFRLTVAREELP